MSSANSERPDPLVGLSFYDFVIERKLAQGGMGAVYLLRHQRYPIRKVRKVILSQYADHPAIRERFEREALAVASLKHPNIAKIDSVGTINGQPCMLIPFLEGLPLDAYLAARGGQLRPHEVLGAPAAPTRGASAPEASSTTPFIAPVQSETRPTVPSAPLPPPAAVASDPSASSAAPAVPSPSAHHTSPSGAPMVQPPEPQLSEPTSVSRTRSTAQPTPPPARGAGKPTARAKPPADQGAPGVAKPPTANGSRGEQWRPDPPDAANRYSGPEYEVEPHRGFRCGRAP